MTSSRVSAAGGANARRLALAAIVTACVLWGTSFLFGKLALRELAPSHVVVGRFAVALALLVPLSLRQVLRRRPGASRPGRGVLPRRADLPRFVLAGALMVPVTFLLQFEGLARTSATSAALLVGAHAPLLALGAVLLGRERLGAAGWAAVGLSTVGVVVMVGEPGAGRTLAGDALVLASMAASAAWVLATQRLLDRYEPLCVTAFTMVFGTLLMLPVMLAVAGWPPAGVSAGTWLALAGLGVGCTTVSYGLWNWGLQHVPASQAGVFINLEPLLGALLGVALLHDAVNPGLIAGGVLIVASAFVVTRGAAMPEVALAEP